MRWPFGLFGRSRSEGESAEASAPPPPAVPRASGRDWAALPPIQRSMGDVPLTASSRSFAAGLPGTVGVPLALQPLGHARSLDAPAGLVTGLATPSTYAGRERLVYMSRRPAAAPAGPGFVWPESSDAPAVDGQAPLGEAATVEAAPAAEPPPPLPAPLAPRAVPAVTPTPAPAPLTVSTLPETALPVAPLVGSRPAASAPLPAVQAMSAAAPAPTLAAPPVAMPVRRLNVGQSRRLGLGPPLSPAAGEAVVQRSAGAPADEEAEAFPAMAMPEQPSAAGEDEEAAPPVQRLADAVPPSPPPIPTPVVRRPAVTPLPPAVAEPTPGPPAELSRPIHRVQRRTASVPPASPGPRADAPLARRGPEPSPAMPVVSESAPAAADPSLPVQRAAAPPPPDVEPPSPLLPAPGGPGDPAPPLPVVPVQRLEAVPPPAPGRDREELPVVPALPVEAEPASLPVVPLQRIEVRPGPAPDVASLPLVPVQRAEAERVEDAPSGQDEDEDEKGTRDAAPLQVVPAQRHEADAAPPEQVEDDLPVVPLQRSVALPDAHAGRPTAQPPLAMPVAGGEPAAPPVVSRRAAGTPVPPAIAPGTTLPLVGDRPLPVSIPGGPALPPSTAARGAATPTAPMPAAATPPLTVLPAVAEPFVQRVVDVAAGAPAVGWPAPTATEAATAALAPVARAARPVAQATPAALPFTAAPADLPYLPVAASRQADESFVQRAPNGERYIAMEVPIVQRAEEAPAAAAPASNGSTGGPGGAESGSPQHSDKELDELARQLYERLRSRLRMELLVDRERSGLITDLR